MDTQKTLRQLRHDIARHRKALKETAQHYHQILWDIEPTTTQEKIDKERIQLDVHAIDLAAKIL